jgi:ABC-type sugar transport system permease subunit
MSKNRIYKKAFVIPAWSFYLLLFILPVVLNFGYSFTNWNAIKLTGETARWVGVKNYAKIFSDPELLNVILRTILYASVTTVFKNVIGFILALGLNEGLKTKSILRAIFFMPSMLSPLIIGLIFGTLLIADRILQSVSGTARHTQQHRLDNDGVDRFGIGQVCRYLETGRIQHGHISCRPPADRFQLLRSGRHRRCGKL